MLESYRNTRKSRHQYSEIYAGAELTMVVPQGFILGPLLFLMYENDLFFHVNNWCNYYMRGLVKNINSAIYVIRKIRKLTIRTTIFWFAYFILVISTAYFISDLAKLRRNFQNLVRFVKLFLDSFGFCSFR